MTRLLLLALLLGIAYALRSRPGDVPEEELRRLWRIERAARRWRADFDARGYGVVIGNDYGGNALRLMEAVDGHPLEPTSWPSVTVDALTPDGVTWSSS